MRVAIEQASTFGWTQYVGLRGAAFIAGVGLGSIGFGDVPQLVKFNRVYQPTLQHRQVYDDRYQVFGEIYRQMKGIYRQLNG